MNTRILLEYVGGCLGETGVQQLLCGAAESRPREALLDDASWSSYREFRRLLEVAAALLADHGGLDDMAASSHLGNTTSPDIARALLAFGSPIAMVLEMRNLPHSIYPILALEPEVVGPAHLRWRRRMLGGFDPFPELCAFIRGLQPQAIHLFGLRVLAVTEPSCQCRGDAECVVEVTWDETEDLTVQLNLMRTRMELAERRVEAFQQTVHDVVSANDLDTLLDRIVRSAARAMQAPGFVLCVDGLDFDTRLYTDGVTVEAAEGLLASGSDFVSVDVASSHRRYGRLVALGSPEVVVHEVSSLDAYARLAATALDSAFALDEARRQAQTAEALLRLSTSLGELTTVDELASKLARAIPDVIDCDCSAVLLISNGVARVAAHHGYPPNAVEQLEQLEVEASQTEALGLQRCVRDDLPPFAQAMMDQAGLTGMASTPLIVDGTKVGVLVASVQHDSGRILDDARLAERFAGLAGHATVALSNSQLHDQIRHQSLHDPLTDLPNRALILDRAEQMLARGRRELSATAALFIDLDGFKEVNDRLGHIVGDRVLQHVATRLTATLRAIDTVGRLGGDEFVVLVECGTLDVGIDVVADRLIEALREPLQLPDRDRPIIIGASIGIAVGDRACAADLLRDADVALYRAKAAGKGCHVMFAPEMQAEMMARAEVGEPLAGASIDDEFGLAHQPTMPW